MGQELLRVAEMKLMHQQKQAVLVFRGQMLQVLRKVTYSRISKKFHSQMLGQEAPQVHSLPQTQVM